MDLTRLATDLASRLALVRPLVCLDLEATGVVAARDRIIQMATTTIFPGGHVTSWSSLVNPEQAIPPASTAIHGITDAMVASAPTFAQLAPAIAGILTGSDLAGYNVERFDRRLLSAEFQRAGLDDPTSGASVVDAYLIFVRQEPRSLDAALRFYGVEGQLPERRAHDASSDVQATLAVMAAQFTSYPNLPTTVRALHEWLSPANPDRIDADGKLVWVDGAATVAFGAQAGRSLAELAVNDRGFLEWIVRKDFSDEVKSIVRDALAGQFRARGDTAPA